MESKESWIFYLKLQKELPKEYFRLDQELKMYGKSLVPMTIRSLGESIKKSKKIHVLIVVRNLDEFRYFNSKVKKILKFMVRTGRVSLYVTSSFNAVNDTTIMRRDFYYFMKLPVSYSFLCQSIAKVVDSNDANAYKWPGGSRSQFKLTG